MYDYRSFKNDFYVVFIRVFITVNHRWLFCQKTLFFPRPTKNCEKISPYCTFWEEIVKISIICQNLYFLWYKLQKFANLGEKIEQTRVKSIKICTLRGESFPPHLFFHTPSLLIFGRIFTYGWGSNFIKIEILITKVINFMFWTYA